MKKKILGLVMGVLLIAGCGKIPTLKDGSEAVVSFKNGDMISVDDLYKEVKDTYALSSLVSLIDTHILENEFPDYVEKAKEEAESHMTALKENYEDEQTMLQEIQRYTGYATVDAYQNYIYLSMMQNHAIEQYAKKQIEDKEIEKYYEDEIVGDIEVSHILITPQVTDKMTDDEKKEAEKTAKEKAEKLLTELKDAKDLEAKFTELAKENSNDDATKEKGGALGKINKTTLGETYDELVEAAYSIKDGAYHKKVVTTELGYHVIMRTKSHEKASLEDSKEKITEILATELLNSDATVSVEALQHYRKEQGLKIEDSELQTQYAYFIQNQLTNAQNANNQKTN